MRRRISSPFSTASRPRRSRFVRQWATALPAPRSLVSFSARPTAAQRGSAEGPPVRSGDALRRQLRFGDRVHRRRRQRGRCRDRHRNDRRRGLWTNRTIPGARSFSTASPARRCSFVRRSEPAPRAASSSARRTAARPGRLRASRRGSPNCMGSLVGAICEAVGNLAGGSAAVVLGTTNGGTSWKAQEHPESCFRARWRQLRVREALRGGRRDGHVPHVCGRRSRYDRWGRPGGLRRSRA